MKMQSYALSKGNWAYNSPRLLNTPCNDKLMKMLMEDYPTASCSEFMDFWTAEWDLMKKSLHSVTFACYEFSQVLK